MKTIPLHGKKAAGRVALVDDGDYDLVMAYRWYAYERVEASRSRPVGPYAVAVPWVAGRPVTILMHKLITGWPRTDHEDHDGLNNQRYNLRPCTVSQNGANSRKRKNCSSAYKGVTRYTNKREGWTGWVAQIQVHGIRRTIGRYLSEIDAARAYDAAALAAFGDYACVNFPVPPPEPPLSHGTQLLLELAWV